MDGILITIIVITAFLVYKMISSSRKQGIKDGKQQAVVRKKRLLR
jgi:hypothetical protein